MSENARNSAAGDKNGNRTTTEKVIEKAPQSFVPIKGRIRQMEGQQQEEGQDDDENEQGSKLDALKQTKNEDNHFKRNGNGKTDSENNESEVDSNKLVQLQQGGEAVSVPTPLPRTSRTNSMTDPSSSEESSSATGSPRPSPMPRVTIGSGYKVPSSAFLFSPD